MDDTEDMEITEDEAQVEAQVELNEQPAVETEEGKEETKELSKPKKDKKSLDQQTIERIEELYGKGYKPPEIAQLLKIGSSTAYKYTANISAPSQTSRTGRGGIVSPEREVARQVEFDITREAISKTQDIYNIGHFMTKVVVPMAESYGIKPKNFVEKCIEFWDEYHASVYEWKRENDVLKALLNQLLKDTQPQASEMLRKKLMANYLFQISVYLPMLGITPTQEMLTNCVGAAKEII